jgi:glyoxylase-like metal-dependent hydrolase (beta-lactamase superfamily II)
MLPEGMHFLHVEDTIWPASANILLISDEDGAILVDVGCGQEEAYVRVREFVHAQGYKMEDVHTVVLTHAHPDHMGAMKYLLQEISPRIFLHPIEIPLAAEPSRLNHTFDMFLPYRYGINPMPREDVDILNYFSTCCPMARADATDEIPLDEDLVLGDFSFQVIVTPGHAQGLVSLFERENSLLFAADAVGDVVAWYSPSSGGLTGFLDGLDRLDEVRAALLIPSHGGPSTEPHKEIEKTRARLLRREERIVKELSREYATFPELLGRVFKDPWITFFPGSQILQCHLDKLEMEGRVVCREEDGEWLVELV